MHATGAHIDEKGAQSDDGKPMSIQRPCGSFGMSFPCIEGWSGKREFKPPWREAGPPNHLNDTVDSEQ